MQNGENKEQLVDLIKEFALSENGKNLVWKPFIITARDKNYKLMESGEVLEEECNHEEADTRLVYLALQEDTDIVVVSKDTDVLILLVWAYAKHDIKGQWYMMYEHGKYADIGKIVEFLGKEVCLALPAIHSLTGCDTTSYFFRVGKCRTFKKILKQTGTLQLLNSLGDKRELDDKDVMDIKEFIRTALYSGTASEDYIDTRIRIYENLKVKSSMPLPPDPLSVVQVIKRAHHQAYTWYHCDMPVINKLQLENNGWIIKDDTIEPLWFCGSQLPPSTKRIKQKDVAPKMQMQREIENDADVESEVETRPKRRYTRKSKKAKECVLLLWVS